MVEKCGKKRFWNDKLNFENEEKFMEEFDTERIFRLVLFTIFQ